MRIGILLFACIIMLICFTLNTKAETDISQLIIEELEFPDTVVLGEVHMLTGLIKNEGNLPADFDFDIGIDFDEVSPGFNFDYIFEEFIPCIDFFFGSSCNLQPGESRSFSKPVYLSNERLVPNQQNVVITWPSGVIDDNPERGQPRSRSFYVQDNTPENNRNTENNDCNTIVIEQLEDVISISGLYSAEVSNISVVSQSHEVIYFCDNDCPNNEVLIDISDGGYYMVQVNLINGFEYCYEMDMIFTENWLDYQEYIVENDFISVDGLPGTDGTDATDTTDGTDGTNGTNGTNGTDINMPTILDVNLPVIDLIDLPDITIPNIDIPDLQDINIPDIDLQNLLDVSSQHLGFGCGVEVLIKDNVFSFVKPKEGSVSILIKDVQDNVVFECTEETCNGNEIIVQLPELGGTQYTVEISYTYNNQVCDNTITIKTADNYFELNDWNNPFDICSNQDLLQAPVVNNILQQSALVVVLGFFADGSLQMKKEDATEWQTIKKSFSTYLLSQLDACTTYEIRALYVCNNTELFSEIITFTTQGCVDCTIDNLDMQVTNIYGNTAIINWDVFSGVNYSLYYKKQEDIEWAQYETPIPFALLFNLDPCAVYEFFLKIICSDGIVSTPGEVIKLETGDCRNSIIEKTGINIFPNAAKDLINISLNNTENLSDIQIFTQSGALIQQIDGSKFTNNTYTLNIANFAKGLYMVQGVTNNTLHHSKFVKQ